MIHSPYKTRTKGFISLLIVGIVAAIALGVSLYEGYQLHKAIDSQSNALGASIQTQLTDTIGTFRTNTNTNFTNEDAAIASITSTQAGYGTIVNQNTPLGASVGGTGTTTLPTDGQFLSANTSNPTWKNLIFSSGLNSTTTATSVTVGTQGFDPTQSIAFTGNNTHAGSETFTSSTNLTGSSTIALVTANNLAGANSSGTISSVGTGATTGSILSYYNGKWNAGLLPVLSSVFIPSVSTTSYFDVASITMPFASTGSYYQFEININQSDNLFTTSSSITIGGNNYVVGAAVNNGGLLGGQFTLAMMSPTTGLLSGVLYNGSNVVLPGLPLFANLITLPSSNPLVLDVQVKMGSTGHPVLVTLYGMVMK